MESFLSISKPTLAFSDAYVSQYGRRLRSTIPGLVEPEDISSIGEQLDSLDDEEIAWRRRKGQGCHFEGEEPCFWTGLDADWLDYMADGSMLHSVVKDATTSPGILDQVIAAGADVNAWLEVPTRLPRDGHLAPSDASMSTPLHTATVIRNSVTVQGLLDRGFNQHAQALIARSQALTPAQFAVVTENFEAYSVFLVSIPRS